MRGEELLRAAQEREEEMAADMMEMSAIPSVNPRMFGEGEFQRMLWIESYLKRHQIAYETIDIEDCAVKEKVRRNLMVRFPGRREDGGTLWFIAHVDTVNAGDCSAWKTNPFVPLRVGDRIYGLGCEDNSQAVITGLHTCRMVKEYGIQAECSLGFLFVSDEETGSAYGLCALIERGIFSAKDEAIVPDAGSSDGSFVEIAEKSQVWLKFTVTGKQAHASMPHLGINAASIAAHMGAEIEDTLKREFPANDPLFNPPCSTFELTQTFANVESPNVLPGRQEFVMDLRILPVYTVDQVMERIEHVMEAWRSRYSEAEMTVDFLNRVDAPAPTSEDSAVVRRLVQSIRELGVPAFCGGIGGGTCAAILREQGIPAVVWSTLDDLAHQPNEYVNVKNLVKDTKVYLSTILKYAKEKEEE